MSKETCIICGCEEAECDNYGRRRRKCPVCGIYDLICDYDIKAMYGIGENDPQGAKKIARGAVLKEISSDEIDEKAALLKYHVRDKAIRYNSDPDPDPDRNPLIITKEWLEKIINLDYSYPNPAEQIDYLVRFLGHELKRPGKQYNYNDESINVLKLISATASIDGMHMQKILEYADESKLINKSNTDLELTLDGWRRYNEFERGKLGLRFAFMAMQFEDEQKSFIEGTVKPIVKEFELDLNILSDIYSKENIIDLKLRNTIKDCSLLICDLTHRNNGAYFEAGFAEGLGKPVIYICEQKTWHEHEENIKKDGDRNKRLHFDVDHQEIYRWKKNNDESITKFQNELREKVKAVL